MARAAEALCVMLAAFCSDKNEKKKDVGPVRVCREETGMGRLSFSQSRGEERDQGRCSGERLRPDEKSQKISEDTLVLKNRGVSCKQRWSRHATGAFVDARVTGTRGSAARTG